MPIYAKKHARLVKLGGSGHPRSTSVTPGYRSCSIGARTERVSLTSRGHVVSGLVPLREHANLERYYYQRRAWLTMVYVSRETRREAPHRLTGAPAAFPAPHSYAVKLGGVKRRTTPWSRSVPVDALYSLSHVPRGKEARSMLDNREI